MQHARPALAFLAAALFALCSGARADPPIITIWNGPDAPDGSFLNASSLADTMAFTTVLVIAEQEIVIADDVDLSESVFFGPTIFDLMLQAPTVVVGHDVIMGPSNS